MVAAGAWLLFGLYAYNNPKGDSVSSNPVVWWLIWVVVAVSIVRPLRANRAFASSMFAWVWFAIWSGGLVGQIAFYVYGGNIGLVAPTAMTVIALNVVAAVSSRGS